MLNSTRADTIQHADFSRLSILWAYAPELVILQGQRL